MIFYERECGDDGAVVSVTETEITESLVTVRVDGVEVETRTPTAMDLARIAPPPPDLDEVFAAVPVVSLEEANDTLLALKAALEARGIV